MTRGRKIGIGVVVVGVVLLAGWLGARALVSTRVNDSLAERGMRCHPIDVMPSADLRRLEIGPTRCTSGGRVRWVRLTAGATIDLDEEQRARRLRAPGLELDLREEPPREVIASLIEGGPVPARVRHALEGLAALAERDDLPRIEVDRVLLIRGAHSVTFRDVVMDRDGDAVAFRVAHAAPPPVGRGRIRFAGRLVELAARATPSEVHLSGRLEVDATWGRREFHEAANFRFDATGIDSDEARYRSSVSLTEGLRQLRERAERRRAERAEAADEEEEDPRGRLHELADRLRGAAERARERQEADPAPR